MPIQPLHIDDLEPSVREALQPRLERLGYLGEFFTYAAHNPAALLAFMQFTDAVKADIPPAYTETVALTVAAATGNDYERHQHEQLSLALGFHADWVWQVAQLDLESASALSVEELAVQRLALAATRDHGRTSAAELQSVADLLGDPMAMSLLLLVGRYLCHTLVVHALELAPPVGSIFDNAEG